MNVLITDLDNTLYDWVAMWHASFKAMIDCLARETGLTQEQLEHDFKQVYGKHGTSEYAFAIQELQSLRARYPGEDLRIRFDGAIHAYNKARKATLALFPSVLETLTELKRRGCLVVGYTESMGFYTNHRLRMLKLDGLIDYLYSPADHDLPAGLTPDQIRHYDAETYRLHWTEHRHTPKDALKPSPAVLLKIVQEVGADRETTIYLGDNLVKDVIMAQAAGITDVFAVYGVAQHRQEYELLRRVTHWTREAVEKERSSTPESVCPTWTLQTFGELLRKFDVARFVPPLPPDDKRIESALEAWKTAVGVQMHFNDIELRIRHFAITILLAALGAAGVSFKEGLSIQLAGLQVSLGAVLLLAGLLGWVACYFMDRLWYHRLLYGAVEQGRFIEARLRRVLPEAGLTGAVGQASPLSFFGWKIRSPAKIDLFYGAVAFLLALLIAGSWRGEATPKNSPPSLLDYLC